MMPLSNCTKSSSVILYINDKNNGGKLPPLQSFNPENISRKTLTKVLRIFDKNFERLQEVSPQEVLSDNVYLYHADEDFVEMM